MEDLLQHSYGEPSSYMSTDTHIALLADRIGQAQYDAIVALLDRSASTGDAERLLRGSEFFRGLVERHIRWLAQDADLTATNLAGEFDTFEARLSAERSALESEVTLTSALRVLRQRAMLHIVWRSFTSETGLDETLSTMSALADCVIRVAVRFAEATLAKRFGYPIGEESGKQQTLIVIGMGKLGGQELNLSSDIDIMFAYDEAGSTQGGRSSISNQEFFTRVAQLVIKLIDTTTHEGRVFRVDTRLRPFGDSGALVASYQALENYYQQHGRDWERYALLKSRCITGPAEQTRAFRSLASRFVYRQYTDFSVIDGLRDMKALIDAERVSKDLSSDVKRGPGGIREAEFIVQSHQLARGGRIPAIQTVSFQDSIAVLEREQCLSASVANALLVSYRHLRHIENAVQALRDEQSHALPETSEARNGLCLLLGYATWSALASDCDASRQVIAVEFEALLRAPSDYSRLIIGIDSDTPALDVVALRALDLRFEADITAELTRFITETRLRVLDPEGIRRLQTALPLIIKAIDHYGESKRVLQRLLPIITAILKRSAYLVLLSENPLALERLVDLVARSQPIAQKLVVAPELLDELLFPERLLAIPSKDDIQGLLSSTLSHLEPDDLEGGMRLLRRFKDAIVFRTAASELEGTIPLMKVSDNLSFLAEVIVERAVNMAFKQLVQKHGEPEAGAGFCVLAYGKLGGIELSYESDLDLVFVYSGESGVTSGHKPIDNPRFFTRLAQRIIHILSTNMMGGRLYEVDLRLRPNGDSGLVVTSISALERYLHNDAWTWEHQALVRARVVAGEGSLVQQVESLRTSVLSKDRDGRLLAEEVTAMRQKMRKHRPLSTDSLSSEALKYARGGIVDIEFVVQYLVLKYARQRADLCRWSDVVRILGELETCQILTPSETDGLREAYLGLRASVHRTAMSHANDADSVLADQLMRRASEICARLLPNL